MTEHSDEVSKMKEGGSQHSTISEPSTLNLETPTSLIIKEYTLKYNRSPKKI